MLHNDSRIDLIGPWQKAGMFDFRGHNSFKIVGIFFKAKSYHTLLSKITVTEEKFLLC